MAKSALFTHDVKRQISSTFKSYITTLTVHVCVCVCVLLLTTNQLAFSVAAFSGLSDVHERLGSLQVALVKNNQAVTHHTTV